MARERFDPAPVLGSGWGGAPAKGAVTERGAVRGTAAAAKGPNLGLISETGGRDFKALRNA